MEGVRCYRIMIEPYAPITTTLTSDQFDKYRELNWSGTIRHLIHWILHFKGAKYKNDPPDSKLESLVNIYTDGISISLQKSI